MHGMYNGSYITCTLEKEHQSQGILSPTFATDKHLKGDQSQELYSIRVKKKKYVSYFWHSLLNTKWWEWKILTVSIQMRTTISQYLINIQRVKFPCWYDFKEWSSIYTNTHLHTHVHQRTLAIVGNFCNACLPQNLLLSWCHNPLPGKLLRCHVFPTGEIKRNQAGKMEISPSTIHTTASICRRNRKPNILETQLLTSTSQPPIERNQKKKKKSSLWFPLILHKRNAGDYVLPM